MMQVLGRYFTPALVLLLIIPAVSNAQERAAAPVTEYQAAVQLKSDDWQERNAAVMFVMELGPRASADIRFAVIDAAWAEVRGETNTPNESEAVFDYMQAVAEMGDPRAIPFLVEVLRFGSGASNALADIGARAFPAVLEAAYDPNKHPSGTRQALTALRFMLGDGILTSGQTEQVRAVARARLSGTQYDAVVKAAVRLALALNDPELRGIVQRFADDRAFADALVFLNTGDPQGTANHAKNVSITQRYARTFLDGGGADIGPFRRPIAVTIH